MVIFTEYLLFKLLGNGIPRILWVYFHCIVYDKIKR